MLFTQPTEDAFARIDNQDASPFFNLLPLELRRAVYAHVFDFSAFHLLSSPTSDGSPRLWLKPCIAPSASDEYDLDGSERCPVKRPPSPGGGKWPVPGPVFKRRVRSSWGPHWMCEELAFFAQDCGEDMLEARSALLSGHSLLRGCKRMYFEVTAMAEFHVADLGTLKVLLEASEPNAAELGLKGLDRSSIYSLSITLSQPLAFFEAIDKFPDASQQDQERASASDPDHDNGVAFWCRLPSVFGARLPSLRKLRVWLDHNDDQYWSVVNERRILSSVEALATASPDLELVCVLPRVHPLLEDLQRHYLPEIEEERGKISSTFVIRRIIRQRYRVFRNDNTGKERMLYVEDFPHTHPGGRLHRDWSREEEENCEALWWRRGINVLQVASNTLHGHWSRRPRWSARNF